MQMIVVAVLALAALAHGASVAPVESSFVHNARLGDSYSYTIQQSRGGVPVAATHQVVLKPSDSVPVVHKTGEQKTNVVYPNILGVANPQVVLKDGHLLREVYPNTVLLKDGQLVYPSVLGQHLVLKDGQQVQDENKVPLTYPSNVIPIGQTGLVYNNLALYPHLNYAVRYPYVVSPLAYSLVNNA